MPSDLFVSVPLMLDILGRNSVADPILLHIYNWFEFYAMFAMSKPV